MAIYAQRVSETMYTLDVSPPHASGGWKTPRPITLTEAQRDLVARNFSLRDFWDAVAEADAAWEKERS
jgi:hypothetical protein